MTYFAKKTAMLGGGFLLLAIAGAAHADQLANVKQRGSLVCGVLGTAPPFGFQDPATRETVGYDVDMCKIVAKSLGVKLEIKVITVPARIPEVMQGSIDVSAGALGWTPARAEQIDYSYGYYKTFTVLGYSASAKYASWADFAGKRISSTSASTSAAAVKDKIPQATLVTFDDTAQVLLALRQHKVEAAAFNEPILRAYMKKVAGTPDAIALLSKPPLFTETYGLGVKKGETALLAAVNEALVNAEKSGEIDKSFDHYLGKGTEFDLTREFKIEKIAP